MKTRLLFIDDESSVLNGLRRLLRGYRNEWDMHFLDQSPEAISYIRENDIDVVIMDVNMPLVSGFDILKQLKADATLQNIEIIMFTGMDDEELKRDALELGTSDLLNKPISRGDLVARIRNVVRAKQYRDKLKQANVQLQQQLIEAEKMKMIGMLAAGAVHDFKNILQLIGGNSQLASSELDNVRDVRNRLEQIGQLTQHAGNILKQILGISRNQSSKLSQCELGRLIHEGVALLQNSTPKTVSFKWIVPSQHFYIQANPTQIYQLLMNICINAVQAMNEKGEILIRLGKADDKPNENYAKLSISDNGIGMDAQTCSKIFEPLYTTKAEHGGSGLGMQIVKDIINLHQGIIHVESHPGKGTTFFIYFPYQEKDVAVSEPQNA